MNKRDEFSSKNKNIIAKRAGYICSNPACHRLTIEAKENNNVNCIGVASHICAAAKGGPRYNYKMTKEERSSVENGIWLCQTCSNLIDKDERTYTVEVLQKWKQDMETLIVYNFNQTIMLNYENKLDFAFDLLKLPNKWNEIQDDDIGYYFADNPAYTINIIYDDEMNQRDFYSFLMTNESTMFGNLYIKYNGICLYKTRVVNLDSGRCLTIVPENGYVHLNGKIHYPLLYKYFIKNSHLLILRDFLKVKRGLDNSEYIEALSTFDKIITYFDSSDDKDEFDCHYEENFDESLLNKYKGNYTDCGYNTLEIQNNELKIALGLFVKDKYKEIKTYDKNNL